MSHIDPLFDESNVLPEDGDPYYDNPECEHCGLTEGEHTKECLITIEDRRERDAENRMREAKLQ